MEKGLIIHGKLIKSETKAVETVSLPIEAEPLIQRSESDNPKYLTVSEVELEVIEYLKGEDPDHVIAIIDGQVRFDDWEARHCAISEHEQIVFEYQNLDEGIAYLKATDDPDSYYLGLAFQHFFDEPYTRWLHHVGNGEFCDKNTDEWITVEDARRRVATVVEEYNRHGDNAEWQKCVRSKHWSLGWKRGEQVLFIPPIPEFLPKQIIHLRDDAAPIEAGTMIWQFQRRGYESHGIELRVWLEGEDAEKFYVTYHKEIEYTGDQWKGIPVRVYGIDWAIWTPERESGEDIFESAYAITATEDLPAGTYRFYLYEEPVGSIDCGQDKDPTEYVVVVTEAGKSLELPPPPTLTETEWTDDYLAFDITPVPGASKYLISTLYIGKPYQYFEPIGEITDETTYTVWLDNFECGRTLLFGIQSFGDGEKYVEFWGEAEREWRNQHPTRECDPPKIRK